MTIHLRGLPNQWDEWRPSKLNLYEGDGDGEGGQGQGQGEGGGYTGESTSGDPSGGAFDGPGAADGFGQGWGDAGTAGPGTTGGGFDNTTDATGMFGDLGTVGTIGEQGTLGDTFGSQGQSLGDTFGDLGTAGTFGTEGTFGDQGTLGGTFGSEGQSLGDMFGDMGTVGTIGELGFNQGGIFGSEGQDFTNVGFSLSGGFDNTTDASSMFGFDAPGNLGLPDDTQGPLGGYDVAGHGVFGQQGQNVGDLSGPSFSTQTFGPDTSNFGQNLGAVFGPATAFDPNSPTMAPGLVNTQQQLGPYDDPMSTISGVPGVQTGMPGGRDAQTAIEALTGKDPQSLMNTIQEVPSNLLNAIQDMLGVNPAQGKDQSQFGNPLSSILSTPDPSQGNLNAAFVAAQNMNAQQAQTNPGLMAAMQSFANPEDPGAKGIPGLPTDPEAPQANQYGPESTSRGEVTQANINTAYQAAQQASPFGPESDSRGNVTQGQINQAYQQAQNNPFNLAVTAPPGLTNPNIGPAWFTQEMQTAPLSFPTSFPEDPGRDPVAINPQNIPTPEQMQEARDTLARDMERGPTNQPTLDEFWEGIPSISRSQEEQISRDNPFVQNPYVDEPTTPEEQQQLQEQYDREQEQGREQQEQRALERSQEQQQRSVPDIPMPAPNPLTAAERGSRAPAQITVSPSRGQERGVGFAPSRGQTQALGRGQGITSLGRGTDRGTGRDSPGVQGLPAGLRGNEIAQALVSRGFDANLVGAALTIGDRGAMLTAMLEAAGLSHAQAVATANAARGAVEAQHGLPSNRR